MRNGDNGVTYTTDGVHYNTAAQAVVRDEWMEVLGYVP
jgi:lysophospholipase L1-like esterase